MDIYKILNAASDNDTKFTGRYITKTIHFYVIYIFN